MILFDQLHDAIHCLHSMDVYTVGPDDKTKIALRTPFGHYQCKFLLFGPTIAPPTFQTVTGKVFSPAHFGKDCKWHDVP